MSKHLTESECAKLLVEENERLLRGMLRGLEEVKAQRRASFLRETRASMRSRIAGEISGLNIAIMAVKRRLSGR